MRKIQEPNSAFDVAKKTKKEVGKSKRNSLKGRFDGENKKRKGGRFILTEPTTTFIERKRGKGGTPAGLYLSEERSTEKRRT